MIAVVACLRASLAASLAVGFASAVQAEDALPPLPYSIQQSLPDTGTRIKPAMGRGELCKMSFPLRVTFQVER